ncbi:hypothetical protein [Kutzneria chonburiensis]|uniref:Secreted protein n=1 Tax=Kutzneria chonburiensis TaxID=1483604 RepID=A0ABV6MNL4_9PSEU|nr:hypothetical protein [Kutzneria chonburiensis]
MRRWKQAAGVLGAVCALTLGVAGTASASPWTWQGYTTDSSWHCGSTEDLNGLYLKPCVKISGAYWQPIMVATATSQGRYVWSGQQGLYYANGATWPTVTTDFYCTGNTGTDGIYYIPPWTSLACFNPTSTNHDVLVEGLFNEKVWASPSGAEVQDDLSSPGIRTG